MGRGRRQAPMDQGGRDTPWGVAAGCQPSKIARTAVLRWQQGTKPMSLAAEPLIAMRGAGYYSDNTVGAKAVIDAAGALAVEAVEAIDLAGGAPFAVADFGAADGGTSLGLMRRIVGAVRARAPAKPVTITSTDLPHNDFSALFQRLHGLIGHDNEAPLAREPGVFTFASGTSFHRQVFPDATLSLGFSATAMHWLSARPTAIVDHVHPVGGSAGEAEAFRAQARDDWDTILLARARELRPGGQLVLANFCIDPEGRYLGNTGGANMFDAFARHWRDLGDAGALTPAESAAGTLQQFYRTPEEFTAPLRDPASPVHRAGLRLEHVSTRVTRCPYAADFERHRDPSAFARAYLPTLRSWTESTFASALDPSRPADERRAVIDRFYAAYEAEVAARPDGHGMDYVHCFLRISKVAA